METSIDPGRGQAVVCSICILPVVGTDRAVAGTSDELQDTFGYHLPISPSNLALEFSWLSELEVLNLPRPT